MSTRRTPQRARRRRSAETTQADLEQSGEEEQTKKTNRGDSDAEGENQQAEELKASGLESEETASRDKKEMSPERKEKRIMTYSNSSPESMGSNLPQFPDPPKVETGFEAIDAAREKLENIALVINDNTNGEGLSGAMLGRVSISPGGVPVFKRETIEGTQAPPAIEGIILFQRKTRAFWPESMEDGGVTPPDCYSEDNVQGSKYGDCATCQFSQWGSAKTGNGQACKQNMLLYVLEKGGLFPIVLQIPPTSIREMTSRGGKPGYFQKLTFDPKGPKSFHRVVTRFELKNTKNEGNIQYSVISPSMVAEVPEEAYERLDALRSAYKSLTEPRPFGEELAEGSVVEAANVSSTASVTEPGSEEITTIESFEEFLNSGPTGSGAES